jgi:cytochrome c oxidase cbb3-type subunit IV
MRLGRSVLDNVAGLEIYAIIGIVIFFAFFIGLIIWVVSMKSKKVDEYSRLPLARDEDDSVSGTNDDKESDNTKNIEV